MCLYHITARHQRTLIVSDMYFKSLTEAILRNPYHKDFRLVGIVKEVNNNEWRTNDR